MIIYQNIISSLIKGIHLNVTMIPFIIKSIVEKDTFGPGQLDTFSLG